jgi:DMSO reductase anchor subunit
MYNFIFYIIYCQQVQKGKGEVFARYNGSLIVSFALIVHLLLLLTVIRFLFYKQGMPTKDQHHINTTLPGLLLIAVIFVLVFKFYNNNRVNKILESYANENNPTKTSNVIKVVLALLIPLIILIKLNWVG